MTDKGWPAFLSICQKVNSSDQLNALFNLLFTLEEKSQLALRVELLKALLVGKETQREIAKTLKISIAKITRGSNALKITGSDIKALLKDGELQGAD